jgi:hypothetical protein
MYSMTRLGSEKKIFGLYLVLEGQANSDHGSGFRGLNETAKSLKG